MIVMVPGIGPAAWGKPMVDRVNYMMPGTDIRATPILRSTAHPIVVPSEAAVQFNPSICIDGAGDLRVVTRVQRAPGPWTWNYTARVDSDWQLREPQLVRPHPHPVHAHLEDLRLFMWKGKLCAMAGAWVPQVTPLGVAAKTSGFQQVLLELSNDGSQVLLARGQQRVTRCEKNWMPCVDGDRLRLVYSIDPLVVIDEGETLPAPSVVQEYGTLHGGSQLVAWGEDGWIALVHRQVREEPTGHNPLMSFWGPSPFFYLHYFARFDRGLTKVALSRPFFLHTPGVEFCPGLVRWKGGLVAAFGVGDKTAWLAEIAGETVEETFIGADA